ncbi:MAG: adenylate/guanylate cyclase domain-containing protein, partial [Deltaproteobacteria bacterium]|nr:adenylate/guanylate cyclase domain-containing protein [Deltaproteobacteria bacterium]
CMGEAATKELGSGVMTLSEFLAVEPWPEDLADKGKPMHWLWTFELEASPEQLWPLVSDTSRLNRSMGLARMDIEERDGVVHGTATHGGLFHEWTEPPWEWEAARRLQAVRKYSRGWAHYVRSIYLLEPLSAGTRIYVYFGWVPRGAIARLMLKLGMAALEDKYRRALEQIDQAAQSHEERAFVPPPPDLSAEVHARIEALAKDIEGAVDAEVLGKLVELIRSADDMELDKIQPRRLARKWGLEERAVLSCFLHATRVGLLDLSWDVVCPLCRGAREQVGTLSGVPMEGTCEVCNVEFSTEEDHVVEVSFRVHPSIREVPKLFYCTAEPATKLHVRLQTRVDPGEERVARPRLGPGKYRMRFLEDGGSHRYVEVRDGDGDGELELACSGEGEASCSVDPKIRLKNDADEARTFVLEGLGWDEDALLPEHLFSFQDFRDLFSSEYVGTDVRLSVGRQTLLFTDIVGSTRFYAERGDPGAFVTVRDHFKVIYDIVSANNGAVVKTIGDAVMAAFSASVDSLKASAAIHRAFDGTDSPVRLRISLNAGPCIAVNWNSGIDYFGGTVNLAAKLQACCETAEVAMSETVHQAPGVADFLSEEDANVEELSFEVKALGETIPVYRWTVKSN